MMNNLIYRQQVRPSDPDSIEAIVRSSGFFSEAEIVIARELVCDRLENGPESSYRFLFAEDQNVVLGYTCYGLIPATAGSYDLYWIALAHTVRGRGLGKTLLHMTEAFIAESGGRAVYAETSSRIQYEPTRLFYERCNYIAEAMLKDFYAPGDSKIIYSKALSSTLSATKPA